MTWLEKFDRLAAGRREDVGIAALDPEDGQDAALDALLDRYRAEGYPGMNAEIPPDLIMQ